MRTKEQIAKELAQQVDLLNPKCLSLGAGMMAHLQQLAREYLDQNENVDIRRNVNDFDSLSWKLRQVS